jgi:DNA polymerase-3 subunit delta
MTAVRVRDAERFIAAPPEGVFLSWFGADAGMVRAAPRFVETRRRSPRSFPIVEMSGDGVASDPLALLDEANTTPLSADGAPSLSRRARNRHFGADVAYRRRRRIARLCSQRARWRRLVAAQAGRGRQQARRSSASPTRKRICSADRAQPARRWPVASPEARSCSSALREDRLMSRAELESCALHAWPRT